MITNGFLDLRSADRIALGVVFCVLYPVFCLLPLHAASPCAGKFYSEGGSGSAQFALTYDDGPGFITEDLLKLLQAHGAKATFFVTGEGMRRYPEKAALTSAAGHLIGNHTDTHKNYFKIGKLPGREKILEKELDAAAASIEKAAGVRPVFMRMPNGYDRDWVRAIAAKKGYAIVNWTYGGDWTSAGEEKMTEGYLASLKPGAILLMHDGGGRKREKTLRITEKLLLEAARKGLKPVTLDVLLRINVSSCSTINIVE